MEYIEQLKRLADLTAENTDKVTESYNKMMDKVDLSKIEGILLIAGFIAIMVAFTVMMKFESEIMAIKIIVVGFILIAIAVGVSQHCNDVNSQRAQDYDNEVEDCSKALIPINEDIAFLCETISNDKSTDVKIVSISNGMIVIQQGNTPAISFKVDVENINKLIYTTDNGETYHTYHEYSK